MAARVQLEKSHDPATDQISMLDGTIEKERAGMRALFGLIDELLAPYANGSALTDSMLDNNDQAILQSWAERWRTVFTRKAAVEETVVGETAVSETLVVAKAEAVREEARRKKEEDEREKRRIENEEKRAKAEEEARAKKEREEQLERESREKGRAVEEAAKAGDALDVAEDDDV